MLTASIWPALAVEPRHGYVVGEVLKLNSATKTIVVKTADGAEHTLRFAEHTAVHGTQATAAGATDAFHGLKEGTQVAVHYTVKGTEETANEIDNVGKDGLKAAEVTVVHVDRGARTVATKAADGTEETYRLSASAAKDAGKDVGEGADQSAKATIYYTEEAGHKLVHFFKRAI